MAPKRKPKPGHELDPEDNFNKYQEDELCMRIKNRVDGVIDYLNDLETCEENIQKANDACVELLNDLEAFMIEILSPGHRGDSQLEALGLVEAAIGMVDTWYTGWVFDKIERSRYKSIGALIFQEADVAQAKLTKYALAHKKELRG